MGEIYSNETFKRVVQEDEPDSHPVFPFVCPNKLTEDFILIVSRQHNFKDIVRINSAITCPLFEYYKLWERVFGKVRRGSVSV